MNTRTCSVIAVLTLMTFYSGCCRSGNFMSGRGARCGLLGSNSTPGYGNPMPGPCAQNQTYQPRPADCGREDYSGNVYSGNVCGGEVYYNGSCGTCGNPWNETVVTDPYMSGPVVGGTMMPYEGQIIGSQVIPQGVSPIQVDDFNARKFDSDGNRILWESPLPKGATAL